MALERQRGQLPFAARINIPDTIRPAELEIVFAARDPDASLEQTERAFSQFVVAAQAGMLSGNAVHPSESVFRVESRERRGGEMRYRCSVRGVDRGAFRILLNVSAEICRRVETLDTVVIWGGTAGVQDSGLTEILRHRYPGRAMRLPFELRLAEFFFENREPLIRMEFRRELLDDEFEKIRTLMEAWDLILRLGGYLDMDERDGDLMPEPGEFFLAEPLVLEHLLYAYQGPAESFNAVINMGVRVHESGCQLSVLEIE
jgi:hypothetical protein